MSSTNKQRGEFPVKGLRKRAYSSFSIPEIDEIREERSSRDGRYRGEKRKKVSDTLIVNKDNADYEEHDLFNLLPDDIICSIISRLSTGDAVRTSVLSKQWKDLWKRSLKKLDFDAKYMRSPEPREFVRQINKILAGHDGNEIESFRVSCYLPKKYGRFVDNWFRFATQKNVQKLDINLRVKIPFAYEYKDFPFEIFTEDKGATLKHMSLSSYLFSFPQGTVSGLRSLKSLTLKRSRLSRTDVLRILTNCSMLEWLSIARCHCPTHLKLANESRSSLRLKHLNISCCNRIQEVDIREAKNLLSFEYKGFMLNDLLCGNDGAPVKRLSFYDTTHDHCTGYADISLASEFPLLETLLTSLPFNHVAQSLPTLYNLKSLVLILSHRHCKHLCPRISAILASSPRLDKLELHIPRYGELRVKVNETSSRDFKHDNLREVVLYNFQGQESEVELLMYLVNSGPAVKNIKVHKQLSRYNGNGEWLMRNRPSFKISRSQILSKLIAILPATVNLDVY